jgi:hypothetical protein
MKRRGKMTKEKLEKLKEAYLLLMGEMMGEEFVEKLLKNKELPPAPVEEGERVIDKLDEFESFIHDLFPSIRMVASMNNRQLMIMDCLNNLKWAYIHGHRETDPMKHLGVRNGNVIVEYESDLSVTLKRSLKDISTIKDTGVMS